MDILLLRFDAPLMSFGGPLVDQHGPVQDFPGVATLTGLLGNALGYCHGDADLLQSLQSRLRYAVRRDRTGVRITDYQTVDLGQDFLEQPGWTTRGVVEERAGGPARKGTHIRLREYWADAVYTIAVALDPADGEPTAQVLEHVVREPARPLFLGRKCCLPAGPLALGCVEAPSLLEALCNAPPFDPFRRPVDPGRLSAWWFDEELAEHLPVCETRALPIADERDWVNQIHAGRRLVFHGLLPTQKDASG